MARGLRPCFASTFWRRTQCFGKRAWWPPLRPLFPMEPAAGTDTPAPANAMGVIRLPSGCLPALTDGARLEVIGAPTTQGILNAELVQLAD